jgi:hypothetical protein
MISRLKKQVQRLGNSEPGRRFMDHFHRRNNRHESRWKSWALITLGVIMVVTGFILSMPPGLPGFLLWLPGLAIIASRLKFAAVALDKAECSARRLYRKITGRSP